MDNLIEIILKGKGSTIASDFREPIMVPHDTHIAQMGLKNFATFNNIPNIVKGENNQVKIKVPGNKTWYVFALETGAYELKVIAQQMIEWITVTFPKLEKVKENFQLIGNNATSKADFCFLDDYGIDFDVSASMYDLLGYENSDKIQGVGQYVGKRIVNITNVTQLVFNCNITTSNYINGQEMPFLFNCSVDVPAGYRMGRELTSIAYKSLNTTQISHIRIWIVDEHGSPVNLRDDDLTVTLSLRFIPRSASVTLAR